MNILLLLMLTMQIQFLDLNVFAIAVHHCNG